MSKSIISIPLLYSRLHYDPFIQKLVYVYPLKEKNNHFVKVMRLNAYLLFYIRYNNKFTFTSLFNLALDHSLLIWYYFILYRNVHGSNQVELLQFKKEKTSSSHNLPKNPYYYLKLIIIKIYNFLLISIYFIIKIKYIFLKIILFKFS